MRGDAAVEARRSSARSYPLRRLLPVCQRGVEVVLLDDPKCVELMRAFIRLRPQDWNEDIAEN